MSAIEMGGTADNATPEDAYTQGFKDGISAGKKRIEELEALLPKAYNEGVGEGMREMNSFHGAKDWEETVSFGKMRMARGE